ncbi:MULTISPECIES: TonB-dependent siderophore receptor [unclassified Bradyrhizobium]|uniref:TonB-dependent receptor n=1 Tax=unclassified Bradyrhizobium TaxID=2631580 RepID=UPI001BA7A16C|nr:MULTISPECIES: TonB-dependent receptor [unclassified Bradyrhizobium]MBR1205730.1 TonB-dependent receptor [Bradyrhizobium sp. AUGA SZCCT0124]MBR1313821.1 TonB-dependent receptor [Bradyrhizobium sp. AUGA SZCCT0051]MBR1338057.1 TonB-dependent receptor [Bradyrhizobium sp. AUGA SZCCT0105]MBR1355712.1 TonB-dependent receptor [Bradyrhizobium sp. AUGA SZCCT0045]
MSNVKAPRSLRFDAAIGSADDTGYSATKVSAVASLIAVASFSGAEAQQSNLPPVNVDAPVARPRPVTSKPTSDQVRARNALRRAARRSNQQAQQAPVPFPNAGGLPADRDRYADPAAPYKGDRLQASGKYPEPILNTPKSVTVLTKDVLEDKNATSLKSAILSTAGVTLGTGEGGNAFGDRFFIRGFDARNDIFIDGVRDAGVSVRENFFTEQVEILRGPGSSFAGRGTTGGAINIVTKQATTENSFYNMDTSFGTDRTKRVTLDVNQVISPTLAIRAGGLFQDAGVAGRSYVTDNRDGAFVAGTWKPVDAVKISGNYIHTELTGIPDFGVPYYRPSTASTAGGPFPDFGVNRNNFYGFVNRDFFRTGQDIGTINAEVQITPDLTISNKIRESRSTQNYIGTLPESPTLAAGAPFTSYTLTANPQSRYQVTDVFANQTEATYKSVDGLGFKHTTTAGVEYDNERSSIDSYTGLASEITTGTSSFTGSGSLSGVSVFNPVNTNQPFGIPSLMGRPTKIGIDTVSGYVMDSANYNDFVILNGGVRYDDYKINTSAFATNGTLGQQSAEFGMPNFNVGLTLKPLPNGSVYAAYATSSNPVGAEFDGTSTAYGGINPVLNGGNNQIFGPEKNKAIEVGTKWELFDRHLLVTAALFQTEKENAREAQNVNSTTAAAAIPGCVYPAGTTGNVSCITAGAAYRIRGIDLGVGGKITDKWSVFGGLVLMQSEVTKSLAPPANTILYSSNVGLPLANVAHQSFSMLTKYQLTDMWELGGQAVYRSKVYGGTLLAANQGTSIPSYWRFDAFAEAKIDKHWTMKLFVNNIFDKRYYDALYQSAAPFVLEAPGRAAYLVVSARY